MDDAVAEPLEVMDELDMRELLMGASDAREAQAAAGAAAAMANLRAIAGGGAGADAAGCDGSSIAEQEGREGEASMAATDGGDEHRPLRSIVGGRDLDDELSADYEVSANDERRELGNGLLGAGHGMCSEGVCIRTLLSLSTDSHVSAYYLSSVSHAGCPGCSPCCGIYHRTDRRLILALLRLRLPGIRGCLGGRQRIGTRGWLQV